MASILIRCMFYSALPTCDIDKARGSQYSDPATALVLCATQPFHSAITPLYATRTRYEADFFRIVESAPTFPFITRLALQGNAFTSDKIIKSMQRLLYPKHIGITDNDDVDPEPIVELLCNAPTLESFNIRLCGKFKARHFFKVLEQGSTEDVRRWALYHLRHCCYSPIMTKTFVEFCSDAVACGTPRHIVDVVLENKNPIKDEVWGLGAACLSTMLRRSSVSKVSAKDQAELTWALQQYLVRHAPWMMQTGSMHVVETAIRVLEGALNSGKNEYIEAVLGTHGEHAMKIAIALFNEFKFERFQYGQEHNPATWLALTDDQREHVRFTLSAELALLALWTRLFKAGASPDMRPYAKPVVDAVLPRLTQLMLAGKIDDADSRFEAYLSLIQAGIYFKAEVLSNIGLLQVLASDCGGLTHDEIVDQLIAEVTSEAMAKQQQEQEEASMRADSSSSTSVGTMREALTLRTQSSDAAQQKSQDNQEDDVDKVDPAVAHEVDERFPARLKQAMADGTCTPWRTVRVVGGAVLAASMILNAFVVGAGMTRPRPVQDQNAEFMRFREAGVEKFLFEFGALPRLVKYLEKSLTAIEQRRAAKSSERYGSAPMHAVRMLREMATLETMAFRELMVPATSPFIRFFAAAEAEGASWMKALRKRATSTEASVTIAQPDASGLMNAIDVLGLTVRNAKRLFDAAAEQQAGSRGGSGSDED